METCTPLLSVSRHATRLHSHRLTRLPGGEAAGKRAGGTGGLSDGVHVAQSFSLQLGRKYVQRLRYSNISFHALPSQSQQSAVNGGHICGCEFAKNVLYYPNKSCVQGQKDAGGFFS